MILHENFFLFVGGRTAGDRYKCGLSLQSVSKILKIFGTPCIFSLMEGQILSQIKPKMAKKLVQKWAFQAKLSSVGLVFGQVNGPNATLNSPRCNFKQEICDSYQDFQLSCRSSEIKIENRRSLGGFTIMFIYRNCNQHFLKVLPGRSLVLSSPKIIDGVLNLVLGLINGHFSAQIFRLYF